MNVPEAEGGAPPGLCLSGPGLGTVFLASHLARHVEFRGKVEKRPKLSLVPVVTSWTAGDEVFAFLSFSLCVEPILTAKSRGQVPVEGQGMS